MDVETIGERLVDVLVDAGLIADPGDLYSLTKEQLVALERMGDKSAQNVLDNLAASKQRPLSRLINGLGIRHVGDQTATLLARTFGSLERLQAATLEEILAVEGIGPKIAESVHAYFRDPASQRLIDKLAAAGLRTAEDAPSTEGPLTGLTLVVTGRLQGYTRPQIEQLIKDLGGIVGDAVSRKTSYLVCGEDAGSKLARAQKLAVPILDEAGFDDLVGR
jgi:DNA ligase (NAD+)